MGCNPRPSQLTTAAVPTFPFAMPVMLAAAAVQGLQGRSTGRIAVLKQLTAPSIDMEVAEQLSTERGIQQGQAWPVPPSAIRHPIIPSSPSGPPCVRACVCIAASVSGARLMADGR